MKNIILLVAILSATFFYAIETKSAITDCGDTDPCAGTPWFLIGPVSYEVVPGCWITVNLEVKNCDDGTSKFRYEILTPFEPNPNNCGYLNYNIEELKRLIDVYAVENIGVTIPSCNEGPRRVVKYDEVACTFEKVCTASAQLTSDLLCNDGTMGSASGALVTYTTKTHLPCGTQCCKIEFDICSKSYTINGVAQTDRIITNFSKSPITPCSIPPPGTIPADCNGCN